MNRRQPLFLIIIILLCFSGSLFAQNWAGILDSTRAINWSHAGIPGGIPSGSWTQCGSTILASTYGNGTSDATAGIQSALNACADNHYVLLGAGRFRVNGTIAIPSKVVLRGAGAAQTILTSYGSNRSVIQFGSNTVPAVATSNAITAGAIQGSTSITVSGSGIAAGQLLMIQGFNASFMTETGGDGNVCSWCSNGFPGDAGQIVEVTGVSGSTVTFRPALYFNYQTQSPKAYRFNAGARNAGLENLQIYANDTGHWSVIYMQGTLYSWVKGVENNFADNAHFEIYYSLGNEIRDNFIHDGFNHGPGGTDNQVNLALESSANLIVNNIMYRQHANVMIEWGAAGNVIAYNYMDGNYHQSLVTWLINDTNSHGAHPFFNLFEGNVGQKIGLDDYWGSNSHTTLFRNWYTGSRKYVPPMNVRGALQPQNAQWEDTGGSVFAYSFDSLSTYNNFVGNIAGSAHLLSLSPTDWAITPAGQGAGGPTCTHIGYKNDSNGAGANSLAHTTMFVHGAHNCLTNTFQWDSGHPDHTLPPSFFLSTKPAWFGSASWPAIGPDVSGGPGQGGYAYKIPAQLCFENSAKDGTGRPIFDPVACYGQQSDTSPPQNLKAVVH